ncbi:hypothetical protein MTP99_007153 [Tenebrio molitor]|nr:hypothetical protein MTP99_007153 [Tenebrio molitor]
MVDNNLKLKISKTKKSFFQNVKFYFKEYCNCSSVHGLRYFVEKERTRCERIWWIAILMSCLIVCAFCISKIYDKWERNAIIINFANKGTSIFNIPFPAITICPESKFAKNKMDVGVTLGGGELEYISLICEEIPSNLNMSEIQGVR